MSFEGRRNNAEIIDKALKRKVLKEMRESGKPLPFEATPEENLSAVIHGAKELLSKPMNFLGVSLSVEDQTKLQNDSVLALFAAVGISDETTKLIIEALERNIGPRSKVVH